MSLTRKTDFSSLMHSFALGCLDKEDKKIMLDYFRTGGDYQWQELGEYQNLASLLPSFLEIEEPNPQIKDKVARRLYRLKEQKRPEVVSQNAPPKSEISKLFEKEKSEDEIVLPPEIPSFKKTKTAFSEPTLNWNETKEEESFSQLDKSADDDSYKLVRPVQRRIIDQPRSQQTQVDKRASQPQQEREIFKPENEDFITSAPLLSDKFELIDKLTEESETEFKPVSPLPDSNKPSTEKEDKKDMVTKDFSTDRTFARTSQDTVIRQEPQISEVKGGATWGSLFFFFILSFIAMFVFYYLLSVQIKDSEKQHTEALTSTIKSFQGLLLTNAQLFEIINSKNLQVAFLDGSDINADGYGKFMFNPDTKKGILQLSKLPKPAANKVYKIWFNLGGNITGKEILYVGGGSQYYPIPSLPEFSYSTSGIISITEEPITGSTKPSGIMYYTGTLIIK